MTKPVDSKSVRAVEIQLTRAPHGHILTNIGVWSADGEWIAYDVRSDPAGSVFDGTRIEQVNVRTGEVRVLYQSTSGANCGVVTCNPLDDRVVFILGPEDTTPQWKYAANRRQGVIVSASEPPVVTNLDARDLTPPFTAGALRGGTHLHVFSPDGEWVSFTYEDVPLEHFHSPGPDHDLNQRNVGVSVPLRAVHVPKTHPRNHDGAFFSVLVTKTSANPKPGTDEIRRACEEAWVGTNGYIAANGTRQKRALAFQGEVIAADGRAISEVFIVDLPEDVTVPGGSPVEGTPTRLPAPPRETRQRRLTYTADRKYPGLQGPRHWLRSSPDGSLIAFLMKDDDGVAQLWTVSPNGGHVAQVTWNPTGIASAFSWSPDGRFIAHAMDNSIFLIEVASGKGTRLTPRSHDATAPRPEACVFSPEGGAIAYVRTVPCGDAMHNQIFIVRLDNS